MTDDKPPTRDYLGDLMDTAKATPEGCFVTIAVVGLAAIFGLTVVALNVIWFWGKS